MVLGRILLPSAGLALTDQARGTLVAVCGLDQASEDFDEVHFYAATDALAGQWVPHSAAAESARKTAGKAAMTAEKKGYDLRALPSAFQIEMGDSRFETLACTGRESHSSALAYWADPWA